MIKFEKFTLENGLKVIVHQDKTSSIAVVNILYNVGAKDENPEQTGFAHLFEHLMFSGSVNVPTFDEPLQKVGGNNNAFTSNDITNYYITLPVENLETAFWLESDRMLSLAFSEKGLEVQRNVVIEEFKQRYLNQPYGDTWALLRTLAYKKHPYQWTTIGKEISHIEDARMKDVKEFFFKHYAPNNAIMVVAGNVNVKDVKALSEKWFGPIEKRAIIERNLPKEPKQTKPRTLTVERDVPFDAIYKVYHMCAKTGEDYYTTDLISDILSNGDSSRFERVLLKEKKMFSEIDAFILGSHEEGLFVVSGKLMDGVKMQDAEQAIQEELDKIQNEAVSDYELSKVKNKIESTLVFSEISNLNKAMNLAQCELLGSAEDINKEAEKYNKVSAKQIQEIAKQVLDNNNCSTLYYLAKK